MDSFLSLLPINNYQAPLTSSGTIYDNNNNYLCCYFTPQPPDGYYYLGSYLSTSACMVINYGSNAMQPGSVFVVTPVNDDKNNPCLQPPAGFSLTASYANGSSGFYVYTPVAPNGYIAVGSLIVNAGLSQNVPPPVDAFPGLMCVRQDLVTPVTLSSPNYLGTINSNNMPVPTYNTNFFVLPNTMTGYVYNTGMGITGQVTTITYDVSVQQAGAPIKHVGK